MPPFLTYSGKCLERWLAGGPAMCYVVGWKDSKLIPMTSISHLPAVSTISLFLVVLLQITRGSQTTFGVKTESIRERCQRVCAVNGPRILAEKMVGMREMRIVCRSFPRNAQHHDACSCCSHQSPVVSLHSIDDLAIKLRLGLVSNYDRSRSASRRHDWGIEPFNGHRNTIMCDEDAIWVAVGGPSHVGVVWLTCLT